MRRRVSAPLTQMFVYLAICLAAAGATALMNWSRPYTLDGGLFDGVEYACCNTPPLAYRHPALDEHLMDLERAFVALSFCAALVALRRNATRNQKITFLVGLGLELLYFGWSFGWSVTGVQTFPGMTWYPLNVAAVALLGTILVLGLPSPPDK